WVAASSLQRGDRLLSHDGRRVEVEEVYDTCEYETVYNIRIVDFHTYFVGSEEWGFSIWAHNICTPGRWDQLIEAEAVASVKRAAAEEQLAALGERSERVGPPPARTVNDLNVDPVPPRAKLTGDIGGGPRQATALQNDILLARSMGAEDIRV